MAQEPVHRRPQFDSIVDGWGSAGRDDLCARLQLLSEWWAQNFPLRPAELRTANAMRKRLCELGGLELPAFT